MPKRTCTLRWERSTTGTHLYKEVDASGERCKELCDSFYIQKSAIGNSKPPMTITLTVEF